MAKGLKKRDILIIKDLVEEKIKRIEWVLGNKSPKEIRDPDQLKESLEGLKELLKRLEEVLK